MALQAAVRTFNWATTDLINATIDVNFGFTPTALIAFSTTSQTVDGISTAIARAGVRISLAAAKSGGSAVSANRRCCIYESFDAAGTADLRSRSSIVAFLTLSGSTGRLDIDAEANWPASSVRFIVDEAMSSGINAHVTVLALAGADLADGTTGVIIEPGATGAQATSGLGFAPTCLIMASIMGATETVNATGTGAIMLSMTDGTRSWCYATGGDDANTTMDNVSYLKSSQMVALMPMPTAITLVAEATLTSLDSDGFTLNWSSRTAGLRKVHYLALKLTTSAAHADTLTTATDTNNFSKTGYGFQPLAALFLSACRVEDTASTPSANSQLSWGMAESATVREAQAFLDEDNVATADVTLALETDELYINVNAAGAVQGLMDLVSFDSDGMTLVMDDADPSQSFVGVLAFGTPSAGGGTTVECAAFLPQSRAMQNVNVMY